MKTRLGNSRFSTKRLRQRLTTRRRLMLALTALLALGFAGLPLIPHVEFSRTVKAQGGGLPQLGLLYAVNSTGDGDNVGSSNFCDDGTGHCTLRAAIEAANLHPGNDGIGFNIPPTDPNCVGPCVINLTRALPDIGEGVSIEGPGPDKLIVRRGNGTGEFRIFKVNTTGAVTFSGMTISNGAAVSFGSGGGGGIYNQSGTVDLTNSTLSVNDAYFGGAIFNIGTMNITNCVLANNSATLENGGGISNGGTVNLINSTLANNSAADAAGGIFNDGTVTITNSTFSGNSANGVPSVSYNGIGGGAFNNFEASMFITNSKFSGNSATAGGGIYSAGSLNVSGSTFSTNSACVPLSKFGCDSDDPHSDVNFGTGGGGIRSEGGTVNVTNSTFTANSANFGAGILSDGSLGGTLNVTNSTLNGNSSLKKGGGIYNFDRPANVTNSTLSRNTAGAGGGVFNNSSSIRVTIMSSIIAQNASFFGADISGLFASGGFNLIGELDGNTDFGQPTDLTGNIGSVLDPKLDPAGLRSNGGPTQTIALMSDSPAIDKGINPGLITDGRGAGFERTADNPSVPNLQGDNTDIGAFEVQTPCVQLADDFTDNSTNVTKWTLGVLSTASPDDPLVQVTEQNQRLEIQPLSNANGNHYHGYVSVGTFNLTDTATSVEVTAPVGGTDTIFAIGNDSNNYYRFVVTGSVLYFQAKVTGVLTQTSIAFDAANHLFWRFRHNSITDQVVFETSPDGLNWNDRRTVQRQISLTAARVELGGGSSFAVVGPEKSIFDNFVLQCNTLAFNTPIGTGVLVQPSAAVTINFANVSAAGNTFVTPIDPLSAGTLPDGYAPFDNLAYDVTTTATVSGPIQTCFNVPSANDSAVFSSLRVFHKEDSLVDRTILPPDSPSPDFANHTICARTDSLSPLVIARLVNRAPVALAKNIQVSADSSCLASVTAQQVNNGSYDPDSGDTITLTLNNSGPFSLGPHQVALTATDSHGATNSAPATVTVVDTTPPTVTAPAPTSAYSDINCQARIPNVLPQTIASDSCGAVTLLQSPLAGTLVGVGPHTITVTAKDALNNSKSATTTFTVTASPSFTVSINPSSVKRGNVVTLTTAFNNCASSRQTLTLKVSLVTPRSHDLMVTLPVILQAGQRGSLSLPVPIPRSTPTGVYTLTLDWYIGGVKIGTSTAQLTVTA